jgi:hypothetical protein
VILVATTQSISLFDDSIGTPEHQWFLYQNQKNGVISNLKEISAS